MQFLKETKLKYKKNRIPALHSINFMSFRINTLSLCLAAQNFRSSGFLTWHQNHGGQVWLFLPCLIIKFSKKKKSLVSIQESYEQARVIF